MLWKHDSESSENENILQIMYAREDSALDKVSSFACGFPVQFSINTHAGAVRIASSSARKMLVGGI